MPASRDALEAAPRILELDGRMTDVEAEAQVSPQRRCGRSPRSAGQRMQKLPRRDGEKMFLEELHGLVGGLEEASGLRLERQHDRACQCAAASSMR